jgi:hypothetical protein
MFQGQSRWLHKDASNSHKSWWCCTNGLHWVRPLLPILNCFYHLKTCYFCFHSFCTTAALSNWINCDESNCFITKNSMEWMVWIFIFFLRNTLHMKPKGLLKSNKIGLNAYMNTCRGNLILLSVEVHELSSR